MNHNYILQRFLHLNNILRASINKNDLAKLRKKTGYTFSNCKKALEVNNNDITQAEKWLKDQAQALGWSKAIKLESRSTLQGLIGVTSIKNNSSMMMEVNCETDFVARNKVFASFVESSIDSCFKHLLHQSENDNMTTIQLENKELKAITCSDGKTLADHAALTISKLGENIHLRRALFIKYPGNVYLSGYTHPSPEKITSKVSTGKYGALIAYQSMTDDDTVKQVARQLCQHIIGMNPVKIGKIDEDEPVENKDDETVMLHQEFLIDPTVTVKELIQDVGIDIINFFRFECGEVLEDVMPSKDVEVSQLG